MPEVFLASALLSSVVVCRVIDPPSAPTEKQLNRQQATYYKTYFL